MKRGKKISKQTLADICFDALEFFARSPFAKYNSSDIKNCRKTALIEKTEKYIVDTAKVADTGLWETGIKHQDYNAGKWIIVDEYKNKKDAKIGHKEWIKEVKKEPKAFFDVHIDELVSKK